MITTAVANSQIPKVPTSTPRVVPVSLRFFSSVSAAAVCCAKIMRRPSDGIDMQFSTARSVPKMPYSLSGIFLEKGWTPNMHAPPATVAKTIQPLCRKKVVLP